MAVIGHTPTSPENKQEERVTGIRVGTNVRSHLICHNFSRLTWAATDQVRIGASKIQLLKRGVTCGATDQNENATGRLKTDVQVRNSSRRRAAGGGGDTRRRAIRTARVVCGRLL